MSHVIRKITYSKWWKNPHVDWLANGELQADALRDIQTNDSRLSVYMSTGEISCDRVIAALASTTDTLSKIEYALLKVQDLEDRGFTLEESPGGTLDNGVNGVHFDIVGLTPVTLYELACFISAKVAQKRLLYGKDEVGRSINASIKAGFIDKNELRPGLAAKLE